VVRILRTCYAPNNYDALYSFAPTCSAPSLGFRIDIVWYPTARLFRQQPWGDWAGVFAHVADALSEEATRFVPRRFSIEVGLEDLVERAVLESIHDGRGPYWATLQHSGALANPRVGGLMQDLLAIHLTMADAESEIDVIASAEGDSPAASLLRRLAQAHRDRTAALARLSSAPAERSAA
jgi:hypothetical protein